MHLDLPAHEGLLQALGKFYGDIHLSQEGRLKGMALVDRYFKIDCASFTPNVERLDHIVEMARDLKANGAVHYGLPFCQPYAMEALKVGKALEAANIPMLSIETDYRLEEVEQLQDQGGGLPGDAALMGWA